MGCVQFVGRISTPCFCSWGDLLSPHPADRAMSSQPLKRFCSLLAGVQCPEQNATAPCPDLHRGAAQPPRAAG